MAVREWLNLSTCPFDGGRYVVVRDLVMCTSCHTRGKNWATNWEPLEDSRVRGGPYLNTQFSMNATASS